MYENERVYLDLIDPAVQFYHLLLTRIKDCDLCPRNYNEAQD